MLNDSSKQTQQLSTTGPTHKLIVAEKLEKESQLRPRWSIVTGLAYSALLLLGSQVIAVPLVMGLYSLLSHGPAPMSAIHNWSTTIVAQFYMVLMVELLVVLGVVWFVRRSNSQMGSVGLAPPKLVDIPFSLVSFVAYYALYIVVMVVVVAAFPSLKLDQEQNIGFKDPSTTLEMVLTFVSLVVLAPIGEEVLFRGFIYSSVRKKLSWLFSGLVVSIVFAVCHLEFGNAKGLVWIAAVDTLILSTVLCWLREKTGRIWSGVLLHAFKNCTAFMFLYIFVHNG